MSSASTPKLRLTDSGSHKTAPRLDGRRSKPLTSDDLRGNVLAFGSLVAIITIVVLLLLNR